MGNIYIYIILIYYIVLPINVTYNETIAKIQMIIPHESADIIEPNRANVE